MMHHVVWRLDKLGRKLLGCDMLLLLLLLGHKVDLGCERAAGDKRPLLLLLLLQLLLLALLLGLHLARARCWRQAARLDQVVVKLFEFL